MLILSPQFIPDIYLLRKEMILGLGDVEMVGYRFR